MNAIYVLIIIVGIVLFVGVICALTSDKPSKSKSELPPSHYYSPPSNTELEGSKLKGRLVYDYPSIPESKTNLARKQGVWICPCCETYVPITQSKCFICGQSMN